MLPLPAFSLLVLLLVGMVPPAAAQSTPTLSLEPGGVLTMMGPAMPTGVYFDSPETNGLDGVESVAVSGELLFVTARFDDALSVWRVNAEAGTLSQTALYQDIQAAPPIAEVDGRFDGLDGEADVAVSSDGELLFVTGSLDDALSVWRVNAEAGTLSQTALYRDGENNIDGLVEAWSVAVSSDGELLFVTARFDDALSVWRVNAEAGTLRQTALYQDLQAARPIVNVDGRFDGLGQAWSAAVSGDLLFVTAPSDNALSVWQVNESSGTLSQAALYRNRGLDGANEMIGGLSGARDVTVSSDGDLLFVTGFFDDALSIWQVNAEAGTLRQTALYQDLQAARPIVNVDGRFDGLGEAFRAAVSGELLFVTARFDDALSVWRVNAEAGTLSQTALYRDGENRIDGLNTPQSVAVSGDGELLFVTASSDDALSDDALSVWPINDVTAPLEEPTVIRVQSDIAVIQEVMVTVTARNGAGRAEARQVVTLSPEKLSAEAIFPAGTLSPGRWIFTAQAQPPDVLDTSAARAAVQVLPPLLSLEPQQDQWAVGSTVALTVRTIAGVPVDTTYSITAVNTASEQTSFAITGVLPANTTQQEVFFPAQEIASLGQWEFFISSLPPGSPFRAGDSVTILIFSLLQLVPLREQFALGGAVTLTMLADAAALTDVNYDVSAVNTGPGASTSIPVLHPAGVTAQEVLFPGQEIASLGLGQLEFSILLPPNFPFRVGDGSTATAQIVLPLLRLVPLREQFALGSMVILTVRAEAGAPMDTTYEISAENMDSATTSSIMVTHPAGVTAQEVFFPAQEIASLGLGQLEFSILLPSNFPFRVGAGSTATVQIVLPLLRLVPLREQFIVGSTVILTVRADAGAPMDTTYEIIAENIDLALASSQTVMYPAGVTAQEVSFPGQLFSEPGQWEFSILLPPNFPFRVGDGSTATAQIVLPLLRLVPLQEQFSPGSTVILTVQADAGAPTSATYDVIAVNMASAMTSSITVTHPAGATEQEVSFSAEQIASTGQWTFSIALPADSPFRAEDSVTIFIFTPVLSLQPGGVLTMMGPAMPTDVHFSPETGGLERAFGAAINGDLLFVTAFAVSALSVWRVNAETGTLIQIALYRNGGLDGANEIISGLLGATNVAVSSDGELLFVTAFFDRALSVWRVNAETGTLSQTALYQDSQAQRPITVVDGRYAGLGGAWSAAVSGDGKLLFVIARSDNALSVWRVNAEAGTLSQTALYRDGENRIDGLNTPLSVAVSGDGKLLFVTAFAVSALSVWRVNAEAGALIQTALYQDSQAEFPITVVDGRVDGLDGAFGAAVSGDGKLLFVTAGFDDALSVWRVNAEAGTLSQAALYQDSKVDEMNRNYIREVDGRFDGLDAASRAAVSGALLFVTSQGDDALSVWQVNAEAGTLSQTALYRDGENRIDGLNTPQSVAVSGDGELLFVTAFSDNALSVWPINDVTVPPEEPTVIRVQSDIAVVQEVMVTVTARNGVDSVLAKPVSLSPEKLSEEVIFPAGTLSPGRWIFTAQAQPPDVLDTRATRAAVQVLPPLLSLEQQQDQLAVGSTVALTVRTIAGVPVDTTYSITAVNTALEQTSFTITGVLPANTTQQQVFFPAQQIASPGQWEFSISLPPGSPFRADESTTVRILSPPALSLQPGGVRTMMGPAMPTRVYFSPETGGLGGASGAAVSGDLLFVTGRNNNALSVWRVNEHSDTLRQIVVYRNGAQDDAGKTISGLSGAINTAVSGDGELLFVTASFDNALSVWRVNAEAGTLSQTAVYQDLAVVSPIAEVDGQFDGLFSAQGVAVSDKLLFVTGVDDDALSVWRINAEAGTLSQTALYRNGGPDGEGKIIDGLEGAINTAVSGDGELLFVTASFDNALSVWRVNAEAGTLSQTALYRNGGPDDTDKIINGLFRPISITVSGNGELLFVTATRASALSVWRVNAEAGTLSQTALYQDSNVQAESIFYIAEEEIDGRFNGLFGAADAALSSDGKSLFVTGFGDDALSVWRVNAEAGTLSQTALYQDSSVQADSFFHIAEEEIDGRFDGLDGARDAVLSSNGELLFITAFFDDALSVWPINDVTVPLEVQTVIRVQSDMPVDQEVMVTVTARNGVDSVPAMPVTLSADSLSGEAIFPAGTLSPGRWIFTAQAQPPNALDASAARAAVQVLPPLLSLEPQQQQFALGSTVALTVRTIKGLTEDTTYSITAVNTASVQTSYTIAVTLPADTTQQEVFFPGEEIASPGQWEFSISLPPGSPFRVGDNAKILIFSQLQLVPLQQQFAVGSTVILTVRADAGALMEVTYDILAVNTATAAETTITVVHPTGVTAQEVAFPAQEIVSLGLGQLEFSILLPSNFPFRVGDGSTATAQIVLPLLRLVPLREQFSLGSTVILTVQAEAGAPTSATYDVIAVNMDSAMTSSITVTHPAGATEQEVSFSAEQIANPGQWTFSIALPAGSPFRADDSVTIFIFTPVLSLQADGMLTRMEHAVPTEMHSSPETGGLEGAFGAAISGELLFVTGIDTLSVWRVNAPASTLRQTALYQDLAAPSPIAEVDGRLDGLLGAAGAAVSGKLLFVTGEFDDALSVWRVNAEAGTLRQTALYRNGDPNGENRIDGLLGARGAAVSGNLLFVTAELDDALSVWRVNAEASTLRQTAVYRNGDPNGENRIDGLSGARGVAVSGTLLFVTGEFDDALSVWRVNAEAGTLRQTVVYRNGDRNGENIIGGLSGARNAVVSGNLLFVTGELDNALSVWRVNAEAGILRQTALYRNGEGGIDGLLGATGVAVNNDLLFVTGQGDNALSVWRVNASSGTLRQAALYRDGENGIDGLAGARGVAISGDLLFVTAGNDNALSIWQINNAEVLFGVPIMIRVQPDMPVGREVMVTITARNGVDSVPAMPVTLSADSLFEEAIFPAGTLSPGRWIFTAQAKPPALLDTTAARTVVQVPPLLSLEPQQDQFAVGSTVALTVRTIAGVPVDTTYSITAVNTASAQTSSAITVILPANTTQQQVFFPAQEIASLGQWEFFISSLPPGSPFRAGDSVKIFIFSPLRLVPLREQFALGSTVILTVQAEAGAPMDTTYEIIAENIDLAMTSSIMVTHPAGVTAQEVFFPAQEIVSLGLGQLEFSILLPSNFPFRVGDGSTATAQIILPLLRLVPLREQFSLGSTVILTVQAEAGALTSATYDIIAVNMDSAMTSSITVTHPAGATEQEVSFSAEQIASPGQWTFSIALPAGSPFRADDSVTIFIFTPVLSLQADGMLTRMEHAVPTEMHSSPETGGLEGAFGAAISGELLFVTGIDTLSVWRVNAPASTLRQTALYQDLAAPSPIAEVDGRLDGLLGAAGAAVSGTLLFVTGEFDDALSVWRVNAEAGTLRQTALYRNGDPNGENRIDGLLGARGAAVSGNLLFVTAELDDALSVWRVNAEASTLRQTAVYRNGDPNGENRIDGLSGAGGVAVNGTLLFVTGELDDALSVWRVNAEAGTLRQTVVYRNGDRNGENIIGGLSGARNAVVSGNLLFVTGELDNALSVWRVNAEAGILRQTALYRNGEGGIDGLLGATGVAVNNDLLFVTGRGDNALSVWRVNASSGTLRQAALYRDGENGIDGLAGARGVAISGDLLFVTAGNDNALSIWQINNAEVPFGVPIMIRVQSDMPVGREVMVTITARNGAEKAEAAITLSPDIPSTNVIFLPGTLSPGRWIFTAQAKPPALLDTTAARIVMQVRAPVELRLDVPGSVTVGSTFPVTVGVVAGTPLPEGVSVTATLSFRAGEVEAIKVTLTGEQSTATVRFTAPPTAGRVVMEARGIRSDDILLPVIGTTFQVTVQPVLALDVPTAPIHRGVMFPVRVRLLGGLLEDDGSVGATVYLRAVTGVAASTHAATLSTAASSMVLIFEAIAGEEAVTAYSLTTEDIDQTGLAPMTRAVLSLQSAATATVFVTRINADLSGNGVFNADDALLIARGLLTENHLARSAGGLSELSPGAFQARLSELTNFADISGDGGLDIIDLIFLTRNPDATVSDLQSRVNAGDNPFTYLCGGSGSDACQGISGPHQNITEGIQYEAIGEVLDSLRRVPQPPMLSLPNNP